ncbi:MAG: N-6 DNA methylase [Phycisphaerae bacterium]|nr:N-6 DNA methylase [Phycisphaerae bacterium]
MDNGSKTIKELIEPNLSTSSQRPLLRKFAQENGWIPSFDIDYPFSKTLANGHLVVEHGLDTTAVITFLKRDNQFSYLSPQQQLGLVSISYNNLVDWHLFPDLYGLTIVNNRAQPLTPKYISLPENNNAWRIETFEKEARAIYPTNIKSLDEVLVDTLLFWKRVLASELGKNITNETISALFNCIIFIRALEDQLRWKDLNTGRVLIDTWKTLRGGKTLLNCLKQCFRKLNTGFPKFLLQEKVLEFFDSLSVETTEQLLEDFYKHKLIPYQYDFSLISKHALSKISEHYVGILQHIDQPQMTFFSDLPEYSKNRSLGAVYTPQFIASFFAKYLKENHTPKVFRKIKITDPACGSGIFLRTILELQCEPLQDVDMREPTKLAFKNMLGIDIDANACQSTKLSISLLHLILREKLPHKLGVINADALDYYKNNPNLSNSFDAVITNPPFIPCSKIPSPQRQKIENFMGDLSQGRIDSYLAHLKLGIELTKPGGYILYVLPHSFLLAENAKKIRKQIAQDCHIKLIADLSEINVFEEVSAYIILLILQKKSKTTTPSETIIVKCHDYAGVALQLALEGQTISKDLYEVYRVNEELFQQNEWHLLNPQDILFRKKLSKLSSLEDFVDIKEGLVTGCDEVFIRNSSDMPKEEKAVYKSYLPDRSMLLYDLPKSLSKVIFYPYLNDKKLDEGTLKKHFPETWKYLNKNYDLLTKRKSFTSGNCVWWSPVRPREPQNLFVPKIVSPHLILLPRFSLDSKGLCAVSRSPIIIPKSSEESSELLLYLLAVLNSSVAHWQIANLSHKYNRGYLMLEPKTLKKIKIPNPLELSIKQKTELISLVKKRLNTQKEEASTIERKIDELVSEIYKLTSSESSVVGLNG